MRFSFRFFVLVGIFLPLFSSCTAGARGFVKFNNLKYPVSLSPHLFDKSGKIVSESNELKVIGQIDYEKTVYSMLYTIATINPQQEFGDIINHQISEKNGDGVINLSVSTRGCVYNYIPIISLLPMWPGCTVINLSGDIIKYEK
jgi:hypothetical protein